MRTLDLSELRLLRELIRNPRETTVALAQKLGLTRNTVQARMASLDAAGAFVGYDRSMSPEAIGYPLIAFTLVSAKQQQLAEIVEALQEIPEVVLAHGVTGQYDLLVQIAAASTDELFRVSARILECPGVERTEMSLSINEMIPYRLAPLIEREVARSAAGRPPA
jgi:DNA-binding Lrp family transcriptional regulator